MNLIYDYETLGTDPTTCPVCSLAILKYDENRFLDSDPYTFEELIRLTKEYKFDITDQVKNYNKKILQRTLEWWQEQPKEIRDKVLKPSEKDVKIENLFDIFVKTIGYDEIKEVYTRGNNFDPIITESILGKIKHDELIFYSRYRDVRTFLSTMMYGEDISLNFIPEGLEDKFEAHNAVHDVAMDVMRMQTIVRTVFSDRIDDIPF